MQTRVFLKLLVEAAGVSGFEQGLEGLVRDAFTPLCDEINVDPLGNIVLVKKGKTGGPRARIMISAHMDEIGLIVTKIEDSGFLRFSVVGGIDPRALPGQKVIIGGRERLKGIIGSIPPHFTSDERRRAPIPLQEMYIDTGLGAEKVRDKVSVGDTAVIDRSLLELSGGCVSGKALDDRAGLALIYQCLRELQQLHHEADLYAVATVQEEVGVRGATVAAYGLSPDLGIAVDVTHGDMPGVPEHETARIGEGPVIAVGPNIDPRIASLLKEVAARRRLPYQLEVAPGPTGTDARAIQVSRAGIPTGLISIPLRYMHTSVEMLKVDDLELGGKLAAYFVQKLNSEVWEGWSCS